VVWLTDLVYRYLVLPLVWIAARIASLFNAKMQRRFSEGKTSRRIAQRPDSTVLSYEYAAPKTNTPRILFHASSMGEFEQLLPVIQLLRNNVSNLTVIASFFSPSGYAHGIKLPDVDICTYLPFDTKRSVRTYLDTYLPDVIVIDRYDVWRTFILEATARKIPVLLINATFPSGARGLLRYWFADIYRRLTFISAVTLADARKLSELTRRAVTVLPDTRVDRVIEKCTAPEASIEALRRPDILTIVLGSCWSPEETLAFDVLTTPSVRLIIVPHEPTPKVIAAIQARIPSTLLSRCNADTHGHILVDSVGRLLSLYAIADAAIVGGGFGAGVHSVTEPAVYGMPIATGPYIQRSADALRLFDLGLLHVVRSAADLLTWYQTSVASTVRRQTIAVATRSAMIEHAGSSQTHADRIKSYLPNA